MFLAGCGTIAPLDYAHQRCRLSLKTADKYRDVSVFRRLGGMAEVRNCLPDSGEFGAHGADFWRHWRASLSLTDVACRCAKLAASTAASRRRPIAATRSGASCVPTWQAAASDRFAASCVIIATDANLPSAISPTPLLWFGEQSNICLRKCQKNRFMSGKMTPAQCQAARGMLNWSAKELAARACIEPKTVHDFERGARDTIRPITLNAIVRAFVEAGIVFPEDSSELTNAVAVRAGVDVSRKPQSKRRAKNDGKEPDNSAAPWDEDTRNSAIKYWRENNRWHGLNDTARSLLSTQLFDRPDAGDEVFGMPAQPSDRAG